MARWWRGPTSLLAASTRPTPATSPRSTGRCLAWFHVWRMHSYSAHWLNLWAASWQPTQPTSPKSTSRCLAWFHVWRLRSYSVHWLNLWAASIHRQHNPGQLVFVWIDSMCGACAASTHIGYLWAASTWPTLPIVPGLAKQIRLRYSWLRFGLASAG